MGFNTRTHVKTLTARVCAQAGSGGVRLCFEWKPQPELRAGAQPTELDGAAVMRHDPAYDGEAEAPTSGHRGDGRSAGRVGHVGKDARPAVLHHDLGEGAEG